MVWVVMQEFYVVLLSGFKSKVILAEMKLLCIIFKV